MNSVFVLVLLLGTAFGATHVNISIAQQAPTNPADVTYIDGKAPAELRAGPAHYNQADRSFSSEGRHSAKLLDANQNANFNNERTADVETDQMHNGASINGFNADAHVSRVQQPASTNEQTTQDMQHARPTFKEHGSDDSTRQQNTQGSGRTRQRQRLFRPQNVQEQRNQEFERYIQHHHSGPTVETVYESSSPAPQPYRQSEQESSPASSSSANHNSQPARLHKFERVILLPASEANSLPVADHQAHTLLNQHIKPVTEPSQELPSATATVTINVGQKVGGSHDQTNFGNDQKNFAQSGNQGQPVYGSSIGQGQTNYASSVGQGQTNFASSVGQGQTNYASSVGQGQTNYASSVGQGQTNYAPSVVQGQTNYASSIGQGQSNYVPSVGQGQTNYASSVGQGQSSFAQSGSNGQPNFASGGQSQTNFAQSVGNGQTNFVQSGNNGQNNFVQTGSYDKTNFGQSNSYDQTNFGPSVGYDQNNLAQSSSFGKTNFDQGSTYDKTNFDQTNFNFGGTDLHNQYIPPNVPQSSQGNYGGYFGSGAQSGYYGNGNNDFYPMHPVYQKPPMVTKTIQIAQPAVKTRKFEVRHPAIQKEYYDIEERVIIKPAGTVVVELDHPVAKIPKGETILPLGHPHPAVASAYQNNNNNNNNGPQHLEQFSQNKNNQERPSGSNSYKQQQQQQFVSSPAYNPKASVSGTTIGSSITATPSQDLHAKDAMLEANLSRQYNSEQQKQSVPSTERTSQTDDYNGSPDSQRQNPSSNSKSFDESEVHYPADVEVQNNGSPMVNQPNYFTPNKDRDLVYAQEDRGVHSSAETNRNRPLNYENNNNAQLNSNNNEDQFNYHPNEQDQYKGEYLSAEFYKNVNQPQQFKPARLREFPSEPKIIKHEHNINLPPMQHNIYLGHIQQSPASMQQEHQYRQQHQQQSAPLKNSRYEEEAARVLEIKPFLQQHKGPIMLYAGPSMPKTSRYIVEAQPERMPFQQQYAQLRNENVASPAQQVQYSAPYSQMRYHPEQSARLSDTNEYPVESKDLRVSKPETAQKSNLEKLNKEKEKTATADLANTEAPHMAKSTEHRTHIEIQIPHLPHEVGKPIFISSTISPPVSSEYRSDKYRLNARPTSKAVHPADDAERIDVAQHVQQSQEHTGNLELPASKPDCDQGAQTSARYEARPIYQQQQFQPRMEQRFMRIIESPKFSENEGGSASAGTAADLTDTASNSATSTASSSAAASTTNSGSGSTAASSSASPTASSSAAASAVNNIDVSPKSIAGHVATPGSRVIAATPAPTNSGSSSESFHKRRIVVNHPFQTVREIVEHEPVTNYHQIQVNEPSSSGHYSAPYIQTHGALVYQQPRSRHGNLQYAGSSGQGASLNYNNQQY